MTEGPTAGPTGDQYRDSLWTLFDQVAIAQEQLKDGVFLPHAERRNQLADDNCKPDSVMLFSRQEIASTRPRRSEIEIGVRVRELTASAVAVK